MKTTALVTALVALLSRPVAADDSCDYDEIKNSVDQITTGELMSRTQDTICPGLMAAILKNESEPDIFKATQGFIAKAMRQRITDLVAVKGITDENDPAAVRFKDRLAAVKMLGDFLRAKCLDEKQDTPACKAKNAYEANATLFRKAVEPILSEEKAARDAKSKEALKHDPEHILKMKFCTNANLVSAIFFSYLTPQIESNCIYLLMGGFVTQSAPGGILLGSPGGGSIQGRTIYIKTKKQYADGDMIRPQFVKSTGLMRFSTVLGAQRTVNAFQYLEDATKNSEDQWGIGYSLTSDE